MEPLSSAEGATLVPLLTSHDIDPYLQLLIFASSRLRIDTMYFMSNVSVPLSVHQKREAGMQTTCAAARYRMPKRWFSRPSARDPRSVSPGTTKSEVRPRFEVCGLRKSPHNAQCRCSYHGRAEKAQKGWKGDEYYRTPLAHA